jgi:hypothetical protein
MIKFNFEYIFKVLLLYFLCLDFSWASGAVAEEKPLIDFVDIQRLYRADASEKDASAGKVSREQQRDIVTNLLDRSSGLRIQQERSRVDQQAYDDRVKLLQDLNVFSLRSRDLNLQSKSLFSLVKRTKTLYGDVVLAHILANPTSNSEAIGKRQRIARVFLEASIAKACDDVLEGVKKSEEEVATAYTPLQQLESESINSLFFRKKFLQKLNSNEDALLAAHGKDLLTVPMPFMWDSIANRGVMSLVGWQIGSIIEKSGQEDALKAVMGTLNNAVIGDWRSNMKLLPQDIAQTIDPRPRLKVIQDLMKSIYGKNYLGIGKNMVQLIGVWAYASRSWYTYKNVKAEAQKTQISKYVQAQLIHVSEVVRAHDQLIQLAQDNPELRTLVDSWENSCASKTPEFEKLLGMLRTATFQGEASFFSHAGRVRAAYALFDKTKNQLSDMIQLIGLFDAHRSIAALYAEHQSTQNKYCFAEAQEQMTPLFEAREFWNPFTSVDKGVANTMRFAGHDSTAPRVAVTTGSNSGGKSTIMANGLGSVVWLSQTLGIAPAQAVTLTPFHYMKSAIKIHDEPGKSHHMAEIQTAAQMIGALQQLPKSHKAFIIADELMEGTDSETGHESLRTLTEDIIKCPQAIAIIVTQHKGLHGPAGLAEVYPSDCGNYKIEINIDPATGKMKWPFKTEKGISTVKVGDRLLKEAYKQYGVVDRKDDRGIQKDASKT